MRDLSTEKVSKYSDETAQEKLHKYDILVSEANTVRDNDRGLIKGLFQNFYDKRLNVGIGFQRAYGAILSGDYFDLIKLPDGNFLLVFADISGHGLPAYTTLIRLRSAITIAINGIKNIFARAGILDTDFLVRDIVTKFTDIMDESNSYDFACVNFTFIDNEEDRFHLKFYNRSMLFPVIFRKFQNEILDVYNLNNREKGWIPMKGHLLGSDVRELAGETYYDSPSCEFTLYEGDSLIYYSDGIIEAADDSVPYTEFGEERMIDVLKKNCDLDPRLAVHELFDSVYHYIGSQKNQKDDMTALLIDFPAVRN